MTNKTLCLFIKDTINRTEHAHEKGNTAAWFEKKPLSLAKIRNYKSRGRSPCVVIRCRVATIVSGVLLCKVIRHVKTVMSTIDFKFTIPK